MGGQESKIEVPNTPKSPHFSSYAKLFTLTTDPRSPAAEPRTPMLVQEKFVDPRSPCNGMERTPIFDIPEPVSPFVRFKMENPAFQDSPLSNCYQKCHSNEDNNCDDIVNKMKSIKVENKEMKPGCLETDNSCSSNTDAIENKGQTKKVTKKGQRRSSAKSNQSLLKKALFKPYVDESEKELIPNEEVFSSTPKKELKTKSVKEKEVFARTPLATKNFVLLTNENTSSALKFNPEKTQYSSESQITKRKLTLRELSVAHEKENVQF